MTSGEGQNSTKDTTDGEASWDQTDGIKQPWCAHLSRGTDCVELRCRLAGKSCSDIGNVNCRKTYRKIAQMKVCQHAFASNVTIQQEHNEQDAREAMPVVFFCTYKTYLYAQN